MDEQRFVETAYSHYMAGMMDCMALVRYRTDHIEQESEQSDEFKEKLKLELSMISEQMVRLRGSQVAEILSDGG